MFQMGSYNYFCGVSTLSHMIAKNCAENFATGRNG